MRQYRVFAFVFAAVCARAAPESPADGARAQGG